MSDVDVIEEVMRQLGEPDYPNSKLSEAAQKKRWEKWKERHKDKKPVVIEFD